MPTVLRRKIKNELEPLIDTIMRVKDNQSFSYQVFKENAIEFHRRNKRAWEIYRAVSELKRSPHQNEKQESLKKLFAYLGRAESLGVTLIDMAVLLLIANGYDFHIESERMPRIRHAFTFKDIERVSTTAKLNFLRDHNMRTLSKMVDTKLRNMIAHLSFTIDDQGTIINERGRIIDIDSKLQASRNIMYQTLLALGSCGFLKFVERQVEKRKSVGKKKN